MSDDPVRAALGDREDLYDVATWDVRTVVDRASVAVYGLLHRSRRALLVSAAVVLFVGQLATAGLLVLERPVIGVLAALSVVPAVVLAGYFWYDDPTRREPLEPLAVTFLLGVLFASFASAVNTAFMPTFSVFGTGGLSLFFFLVVGPIEETVKWLAVRVHAVRTDTFDAVVDGMVYGAVAGLGFATVENLVYILRAYLVTASAGPTTGLQVAVATAAKRAFVGPGHVLFSAFSGYYLGLATFNPGKRGPIVVKGLLVAALVHGAYNTTVSTLSLSGMAFVAFLVVFDGVLLVVLSRKVTRYRRHYRRAVQGYGPGSGG